MESIFLRLVAIVILVLGLVSIDSGFTLMGFTSVMNWMQTQTPETQGSNETAAINNSSGTIIQINASNSGYSPRTLHVKANTPITLNLVTEKTYSCARDFLIPDLSVERLLPDTGIVSVDIPAQKTGTVMNFTCSMGMYTGVIIFDRE